MEPLASHAEPSASLRTIDGRYRIESEIGHGAMGTVCRAWDTTARRPVALKMLALTKVDGARLQRAQRWFRREFHVVAGLQHPRIVQVYDFGLDAGSPYYTMELLDGRDLRDVADIDLDTGVRILRDLASALAYLHARRLVHRDLKPRNVRCTSDGRAKLIDFGILAAVGTVGEIAGTPTSMAPEGVRGAPLDGRASAEWYQRAASKGHATAQFELGRMYAAGIGVTKDEKRAAELMEQAANQRLPWAMQALAGMYLRGAGVAKNDVQAYKWFSLAIDEPETAASADFIKLAKAAKAELDKTMPADSVREANKLAADWQIGRAHV